MQIIVYASFQFTDDSNNCSKNGELSILYDVPKGWENWDEEKREKWLLKNYDKIDKAFNDAMCVVHNEGGVRIDIWTHLMRGCTIELCTLIRKECVRNGKEKSI